MKTLLIFGPQKQFHSGCLKDLIFLFIFDKILPSQLPFLVMNENIFIEDYFEAFPRDFFSKLKERKT